MGSTAGATRWCAAAICYATLLTKGTGSAASAKRSFARGGKECLLLTSKEEQTMES